MFRRIQDFLESWAYETDATLKVFEKLTDASLDQKVTPEGRSLGRIAWHIVATSATLVGVSSAPTWLGITGRVYLFGVVALGILLLWLAISSLREKKLTPRAARRVFLGSLAYHPLFLLLLLVDAIRL